MPVPSSGEVFTQLIEHLTRAQESCSTLSHLEGLNSSPIKARGWSAVAEMLKLTIHNVTDLATKGLH
jgi:hypothetical protein